MEAKAVRKHIAYFQRHLVYFPEQFQGYDSSHTSLVFFCCLGLKVLGQDLDETLEQWVWQRYVPGGFLGSLTHTAPEINFASTYFCLCILAMLGTEPRDIAGPVAEAAAKCQLSDGSFTVGLYIGKPCGESSLRHMYSVLGSLYLLNVDWVAGKQKSVEYVLRCQNYDGGFGETVGSESHAGLTYCAVAVLVRFCGAEKALSSDRRDKLVSYLLHCQQQNGGFNGRCNKPTDTCYSFWAGASLATLGEGHLVDQESARAYLRRYQHAIGGLSKTEGGFPDPLHSALGLAAMSIFGGQLEPLDASLCLPQSAAKQIEAWRAKY